MSLLAIDPGPERSAWLEHADGHPRAFGIVPNDDLLEVIWGSRADALAIESIASYGMPVGADVFETAVWVGRLIQRWADVDWLPTRPIHRVYRKDVKLALCGSVRAKDANVRQALIDMYGPGKEKAIGKKASQGPLYGISSHVWSALAVAVVASEWPASIGEAAA